jgi:hypothetical protein
LVAVIALIVASLLVPSCGPKNGSENKPSPDKGSENQGSDVKAPSAGEGGKGGRVGEVEEEEEGPSSLRPRERQRLVAALQALQNNLLLADPEGFETSFLTVSALGSILSSALGKEAWKKMVAAGGGDRLDFEVEYKKSIRSLYDDLREPGGRCGLDRATLQAVRNSGIPPTLLFADTFASPLGRNFIVALAGLKDDRGLKALLRIRAMPHHNKQKWYLHGDERIDTLDDRVAGERADIGSALETISKEQDAFRGDKVIDRDSDGKGEFGFLPELSGIVELRGSENRREGGGIPPLLREVAVNGVALLGTHLISVHLPGDSVKTFGDRPGAQETSKITDLRERVWCAVAWPVAKGCGRGLYFVGPSGRVLVSEKPSSFFGLESPPPPAVGFRQQTAKASEGWGTAVGPGESSGAGIAWKALD